MGQMRLVRRILEASGGIDKVDYEEAKQIYRKWFEEDPFYHVKPFDGIVEMLNGLKKEGIKIGVCSNKPHHAAVDVVNKIFGEELFDKVQGQTAEIPRKPSPHGPLADCRKSSMPNLQSVFIWEIPIQIWIPEMPQECLQLV